ncbi:OmpW/AlkL family protein [Rudaea sp.]|uniref:OmpW/AlkL family protein n=1 Tax=Rudaea sp. TaxID=2136325 RepID=UPI002ED4D0BD
MNALRCFCVASLLACALPAHAEDDHWLIKVGAHNVDPKSNNGTLANGALKTEVGSSARPTATFEYLFNPNLGIEALVALPPFDHTVKLNGANAASVHELPPTVSLQYHFNPSGSVSPYVGLGLNYTKFFEIKERGPLAGTKLRLSDSVGIGLHAGLDFRLKGGWIAGIDLRWISISTDAKVNGAKVGTVNIDPLVYGGYIGYRF